MTKFKLAIDEYVSGSKITVAIEIKNEQESGSLKSIKGRTVFPQIFRNLANFPFMCMLKIKKIDLHILAYFDKKFAIEVPGC